MQTGGTSTPTPQGLAILGSTGSIGTQTLEVVRQHADQFRIEILTASHQADLLIRQALEFKPNAVVIGPSGYVQVQEALSATDTKVFSGFESLCDVVTFDSVDTVVVALTGSIGLKPTLTALEYGKQVALANKETLVMGGNLVRQAVQRFGKPLYPIDSEHSAIFQCLQGEPIEGIEKLLLTGSGGPFRGRRINELQNITPEQALAHPTWQMGPKISIDSATLMNKGLELIEACHLFGVGPQKVQVLIHPQSIIHSLVSFVDGSVKAQLAPPDMKGPILYALSYPRRWAVSSQNANRLDLAALGQLTFENPDRDTFVCLRLAEEAMISGGGMPCALNAANEIAVQAFLDKRIGFLDIGCIVASQLEEASREGANKRGRDLEDLLDLDKMVRIKTLQMIEKGGSR